MARPRISKDNSTSRQNCKPWLSCCKHLVETVIKASYKFTGIRCATAQYISVDLGYMDDADQTDQKADYTLYRLSCCKHLVETVIKASYKFTGGDNNLKLRI